MQQLPRSATETPCYSVFRRLILRWATAHVVLAMLLLSGAAHVAADQLPPGVLALAAKAEVREPIVAWCKGTFRPEKPIAYALAVSRSGIGGRYLAIDSDGQVTELASFTGGADLACYTPTEAKALSASIANSETIQGSIAPLHKTTVVCAFVEETAAACWQYSTADKAFVRVGGWTT